MSSISLPFMSGGLTKGRRSRPVGPAADPNRGCSVDPNVKCDGRSWAAQRCSACRPGCPLSLWSSWFEFSISSKWTLRRLLFWSLPLVPRRLLYSPVGGGPAEPLAAGSPGCLRFSASDWLRPDFAVPLRLLLPLPLGVNFRADCCVLYLSPSCCVSAVTRAQMFCPGRWKQLNYSFVLSMSNLCSVSPSP